MPSTVAESPEEGTVLPTLARSPEGGMSPPTVAGSSEQGMVPPTVGRALTHQLIETGKPELNDSSTDFFSQTTLSDHGSRGPHGNVYPYMSTYSRLWNTQKYSCRGNLNCSNRLWAVSKSFLEFQCKILSLWAILKNFFSFSEI